jgi:class 3 adenylate cyclase/predicted ATPase
MMRCPSCHGRCSATARFCANCGVPIMKACSKCGTQNPATAVVCCGCGALIPKRHVEHKRQLRQEPLDRRQVTIMFCDLVDSTPMSERIDPELLREVILAYRSACAAAVQDYDGQIANFSGDGVLIYFGYPTAHEDDALRAIHAGREILTRLNHLSRTFRPKIGMSLDARIGIHTGLVVAGDLGSGVTRESLAVVSDTPNIAARVQRIARPGNIVITEATRGLVDGHFLLTSLGAQNLKGISEPTCLFEVTGQSSAATAFDARAARGLVPFVGRRHELSRLLDRWAQAEKGIGQTTTIVGEAGVGKTRLIRSFIEQVPDAQSNAMLCYCSPFRTNSAFYPVIKLLENALDLSYPDQTAEKLAKLNAFMSRLDIDPRDGSIIASFLSLETSRRSESIPASPRQFKHLAKQALTNLVAKLSEMMPALIVVEDVHWIDPSTLEFLHQLVGSISSMRAMIVLSHRPGFKPPWEPRDRINYLELAGLPPESCSRIIASIAGGRRIPAAIEKAIVSKSDGMPLFVEELTRNVLESGTTDDNRRRGRTALEVPRSLKDSFMARLDRLGSAKTIAQVAAVIGRRFDAELVICASGSDQATVTNALNDLCKSGIVYRSEGAANDQFMFKHALLQDAAYDSLLKSSRASLHEKVARTIETKFPQTAAAEPELLAHHFIQAGSAPSALPYLNQAVQAALARAAYVEALTHIATALDIVCSQPATIERYQAELSLLIWRGLALTATRSYAAPEVGANYARAHELCTLIGDVPQVFPVLHGLYRYYLVRAELSSALKTSKQLLTISSKTTEQTLLTEASQAHAFSLGFTGELRDAQRYCDECLRSFDPKHINARLQAYSTDTASSVLCLSALMRWLRGYPDQAAATIEQALARAGELNHPYTSAWVLNFAAVIFQLRGEVGRARKLADDCVAHSSQHEFPFWLAGGHVMRGWCRAVAGEPSDDAVSELLDGREAWRATGAVLFSPYYLCCAADVLTSLRRGADVAGEIEQTISQIERTNEGWWEAEVHRLRGKIAMQSAPKDRFCDPEEAFSDALRVARSKGSRSLELRTCISLGELWIRQDRVSDARELLYNIYEVFDEGFETADLQAAKQILEMTESGQVLPSGGLPLEESEKKASTRRRTSDRSPLV